MEDLTEFRFAEKFLDSYEHFKILCQAKWFLEHVQRWREELRLKLRAQVLERLTETAKSGGKNSFEADKILLNELTPKQGSKRGRPEKEAIQRAVKDIAREEYSLNDDHKRIFAG